MRVERPAQGAFDAGDRVIACHLIERQDPKLRRAAEVASRVVGKDSPHHVAAGGWTNGQEEFDQVVVAPRRQAENQIEVAFGVFGGGADDDANGCQRIDDFDRRVVQEAHAR
jgi:hypothetical protein